MREYLGAALIAMAVVAPEKTEAQIGVPLDVLCTSSAQEYCMAFFTWDASLPGTGLGSFSTVVQPYGSAITEGATRAMVWTTIFGRSPDGSICGAGQTTAPQPVTLGATLTFSDNGPACPSDAVVIPSSPADLDAMVFFVDAPVVEVVSCGRLQSADCVSVPEPSTLLLMLTGVWGLGLVARRRREEAQA